MSKKMENKGLTLKGDSKLKKDSTTQEVAEDTETDQNCGAEKKFQRKG